MFSNTKILPKKGENKMKVWIKEDKEIAAPRLLVDLLSLSEDGGVATCFAKSTGEFDVATWEFETPILCSDGVHVVSSDGDPKTLKKLMRENGIKDCWYHAGKYPHYDLPKRMRNKSWPFLFAVSSKTIIEIVKEFYRVY